MNASPFATGAPDPWCPGCGHLPVVRALYQVLARRYRPLDVVLVTDIGCVGMADALFTCHTVHGLHGRSPALAAGLAMNLPEGRKVVTLMGDGGAAIGLQHVLECARLNVDMLLVVCDNQNYGMTGGQHSAYTLPGVRTTTTPEGSALRPFPLCELVAPLGVFRARTLAVGPDLVPALDAALGHRGFALVETLNWCPSYAGKQNPDRVTPRGLAACFEANGLPLGTWPAPTAIPPFRHEPRPRPRELQAIPVTRVPSLDRPVRLLLAGSAGEGVQLAAEVFARAAVGAGLQVALRGEYPVTVGKGFSSAFLVLSPRPVLAPAGDDWEVGAVTSVEGLRFALGRVAGTPRVVLDASLEPPPALACADRVDLRRFGARQAAFAALAWWLRRERWFPLEALAETVDALASTTQRDTFRAVLEGLPADPSVPA